MEKLDVPVGDAAPEQPKDSGMTKKDSLTVPKSNTKKFLLGTGFFSLLIVAAVLIGVLPDWDKESAETQGDDGEVIAADTMYLQSVNGTFDVKIPLFSPKITEGYSSEEDLTNDLEQLAKFLLNDAINYNKNAGKSSGTDTTTGSGELGGTGATPVSDEGDSAAFGSTTADAGGRESLGDVNAYETNNQEFSIDRADFVKSDGNVIFAAYADFLVVWTIDGQGIITQIQMPAIDVPNNSGGIVDDPSPMPADGGGESAASEPAAEARSDIGWWEPKPRIEALLIHGNRLTAVISGYGIEYANELGYIPTLYDYLGTKIQVYNINGGNLELVSETDVNGSFRNAYSVGQNAYIVTQSSINTWDHLLAPVQRWQPQYEGLDDEAYVQAVVQLVDEGLVDEFVDQLLSELRVNGDIDLARLSVFTDSLSEENLDNSLYSGGVANAVSQVVAFDMTEASLTPHVAATFQPGSWGYVYATSAMIIVADQGWSWMESENRASSKTYLIGFRLDGPSSSHDIVGSVDGYILNPFSLDFVEKPEGSYVRIATTQDFWTPWIIGRPVDDGEVIAMVDSDTGVPEDGTEPESLTTNLMIVLKIPSAGTTDGKVLQQVGSVELGEPNERFTSVRFFDDFAYAVTFEQIDPFYVIDLSNEQPVVLGELKINGFSEYLHPIDSNDQFLLAIGQDANENGEIIGYMVSLFDATDATAPALVDRLTVEQEQNSWSSSTASWDERAFRFVPLGDKEGKLIIPLSIYSWQEFNATTGARLENPIDDTFEGFTVFNIEGGKITKDFDIDHSLTIEYNEECNYYYEWLPERSFVFNGNVLTMKKHTIISTSLTTGETLWTAPLNEDLLGCDAGV